ncbi:unnamed protein product, partial [Iphiclides podalirius]
MTTLVAADWRKYTIFPNKTLAVLETLLGDMQAAIRRVAPRPVIVAGDFNAKNTAWGSPATDVRGIAVEVWATESGLALLNCGTAQTCVRVQGGSIVDLSFASPAVAQAVRDWRVMGEVETLSDHLYIRFSVSSSRGMQLVPAFPAMASTFPRWALAGLDVDLLKEAAIVESWSSPPPGTTDEEAMCFRSAITRVCDACMVRVRQRPQKRQVDIADLRRRCVAARRKFQRQRRRRPRNEELNDHLQRAYHDAKKSLQLAILRANDTAWGELLAGLDRDPWVRPYRATRGKLGRGPPPAESISPERLATVLEALFPAPTGVIPPVHEPETTEEVPLVSEGEMGAALLRLRGGKTAPGPDGVPGRALVLALGPLEERLRELFTACLRRGEFPQCWKAGRVVLLRKEGRPEESPSAYRPIILLDEAGKLLERVVARVLTCPTPSTGSDHRAPQ